MLSQALLLWTIVAWAHTSPVRYQYDVIVVGMGASGCAAASKMAQAGKKVLALEAQDRIGGRVHTVPVDDEVVEVGAEWIHGTNNSVIYDLALQNNVSVISQDISFEVFESDGSQDYKELFAKLTEYTLEIMDEEPELPEPLGVMLTRRTKEYLKEKYPQVLNDKDFMADLLHFLEVMINNYEASNDWNDLTTHTGYEDIGGDLHMSWNKNGYSTLFKIFLNAYLNGPGYLNLDIKLQKEVTKIAWTSKPEDKVHVTCADDTHYTAEQVIVTASLGVLKERHETLFSPQLPQIKKNAIDNITMGVAGKIILVFKERWWPTNKAFRFFWRKADKDKLDEADSWLWNIADSSTPQGCSKCLTIWTKFDTTIKIENLPEETVKTKVMGVLRHFMGKNYTIPDPVNIIRTTWYTNPFIRGTYTYDNVNAPLHPTARSELAAPLVDAAGVPRVLFAGEATNTKHFGTVHGATETGYREAERLLSAKS